MISLGQNLNSKSGISECDVESLSYPDGTDASVCIPKTLHVIWSAPEFTVNNDENVPLRCDSNTCDTKISVFIPLHSQTQLPNGPQTEDNEWKLLKHNILVKMENVLISLCKRQLLTFTATDTVLQISAFSGPELYLLIFTTIKQLWTLLRFSREHVGCHNWENSCQAQKHTCSL